MDSRVVRKKNVRIIDAPTPDITQPDGVIVKVTGTTIRGKSMSLIVTFLVLTL